MNEVAAANILDDVVSTQAIMMEILIYGFVSILILLLMDAYAAKRIGDKTSLGYKVLRVPKYVSLLIICGFTLVIGLLCMYADFSVTRRTLTYLGLPYFIALVYYMIKMLRRVKSETKRRHL